MEKHHTRRKLTEINRSCRTKMGNQRQAHACQVSAVLSALPFKSRLCRAWAVSLRRLLQVGAELGGLQMPSLGHLSAISSCVRSRCSSC